MPIVNIDLAWLNRLLGKPYETETLRESLEQIGCDVEDVVDIERSRCPQCGSLVEHPLGAGRSKGLHHMRLRIGNAIQERRQPTGDAAGFARRPA